MGALRKAGVWLGLVEEDERTDDAYDEYADEDDDFTPSARPRPVGRQLPRPTERDRHPIRDRERERERERDRVDELTRSERPSVRPLARPTTTTPTVSTVSSVNYPTQDNLALAPQPQLRERSVAAEEPSRRYQITTLHPTTYREARAIGEHFRDGLPVIINLTEMDEADARRLVDFAAGLAFGLRGNIERVTNRVFLLSPANVQVTAEDKAKIAEGGFFDQG